MFTVSILERNHKLFMLFTVTANQRLKHLWRKLERMGQSLERFFLLEFALCGLYTKYFSSQSSVFFANICFLLCS